MLFLTFIQKRPDIKTRLQENVRKLSKRLTAALVSTSLVTTVSATLLQFSGIFAGSEVSVLISIAIMFLILSILTAAVAFSPKKLFLTTGACIAFILAAALFELAIAIISFIENPPIA